MQPAGSIPSHGKKCLRERIVTAGEYLHGKIPAAPSVGQKISAVLGTRIASGYMAFVWFDGSAPQEDLKVCHHFRESSLPKNSISLFQSGCEVSYIKATAKMPQIAPETIVSSEAA